MGFSAAVGLGLGVFDLDLAGVADLGARPLGRIRMTGTVSLGAGRCTSTLADAMGLVTSLLSAFPMMLGAADGLGFDRPRETLGATESLRAKSNCSALLLGWGGAALGFGLDLVLGACVGTGTGTGAVEGLGVVAATEAPL